MSIIVDFAKSISRKAHASQMYNGTEQYYLHPLRVWETVMSNGAPDPVQIVALLHDLVEDTAYTVEDIRNLFGDTVADAVGVITRNKEGETYAQYIERVKVNRIAREVKLADLKDNLSHCRDLPTDHPKRSLISRYENAIAALNK